MPGHWEGDLILGKDNASAVGTLVERVHPLRHAALSARRSRRAESVRKAMTAKVATLPEHLMRSITWDQGKEMAQHRAFSVETGIPIYFCDPHSPWQRPIQREHQRHPTPIDAQRHRPLRLQRSRP